MASKVEIANRTLTKLGAERILALSDEGKNARTLNSMFDIVRDAELRRNLWNFAAKRTNIAAQTTAPDWGFAYAYPLPADFLRLRDIYGAWTAVGQSDRVTGDNSVFRIENVGGVVCIATDIAAPLYIRYTARIEDTQKYDPAFVEALACRLSIEACESITGSSSKKAALQSEYIVAVREAIAANAVENPPQGLAEDSWILSRD